MRGEKFEFEGEATPEGDAEKDEEEKEEKN